MKSGRCEFSFAADRTLGKLAKWLRILGLDTLSESEASGRRFFQLPSAYADENRIVLTRNNRLKKHLGGHRLVFIMSNHCDEQLRQVITETGIREADLHPFSRCLHCNLPVHGIAKKDVYERVPDYIFASHDKFHTCLGCNRIFWPGSHTDRSLERIRCLLDTDRGGLADSQTGRFRGTRPLESEYP